MCGLEWSLSALEEQFSRLSEGQLHRSKGQLQPADRLTGVSSVSAAMSPFLLVTSG